MTSLTELFELRQHGNVADKWSSYLREYDRLFAAYTTRLVNFLEIGVQNGGSLDVWASYFAKGSRIVGCDINPLIGELQFESAGVAVVIGDINQVATRNSIFKQAQLFDIVIDDGSHTSPDIIQTFCSLFGRVADGGLYVIEDMHCSFWLNFGGGLHHPKSAYAFFKALVDVCNYEHWGLPIKPAEFMISLGFDVGELAEYLGHIHSIEFLNSLCVIHKQSPEQNRLGFRVVKGNVHTVCDIDVKLLDGDQQPVPNEQSSPYRAPIGTLLTSFSIDKLTHELQDIYALLKGSLARRDQVIAEQSMRLSALREELLRAEAQLDLFKDVMLGSRGEE